MKNQNEKVYQATRAEAQEIIKRAKVGSTFNVMICVDLRIADNPNHIFQDGGTSSISVSKKEALRLADSLLSETMEGRGGRLRIRCYERESYKRVKELNPLEKVMVTTYWIG